MENLELTFVGSGDYCNHGGRAQQALLLSRGQQGLLVDFGANTCQRLKALGLGYDSFQTVLLTHFHGDHCGGLPYMIAERNNEAPAGQPLAIVGPAGVARVVDNLCLAMGYSVPRRDLFTFTDFYDGYENKLCKISSLPMQHRPESLGYRLDFGDLVVAVTGDSRWCDNIVRLAEGADLLICDVNQARGLGQVHVSLEEVMLHRAELHCRHILPIHIADLGTACPLPPVTDGSRYQLSASGTLIQL